MTGKQKNANHIFQYVTSPIDLLHSILTSDRRKQGGGVKNVFSLGIRYFKEQHFVQKKKKRGKTFENSLLITDVRNKLLSFGERILCFPAKDTVALFQRSDSYNYSSLLANWDVSAEGFPEKQTTLHIQIVLQAGIEVGKL